MMGKVAFELAVLDSQISIGGTREPGMEETSLDVFRKLELCQKEKW